MGCYDERAQKLKKSMGTEIMLRSVADLLRQCPLALQTMPGVKLCSEQHRHVLDN